jgi:hypothetical protein
MWRNSLTWTALAGALAAALLALAFSAPPAQSAERSAATPVTGGKSLLTLDSGTAAVLTDAGGNGILFGEQPPHLTLEHTRVIGNTLRASPGLPVEGGGIYTAFPVALDHSLVAHNIPDQCFGC